MSFKGALVGFVALAVIVPAVLWSIAPFPAPVGYKGDSHVLPTELGTRAGGGNAWTQMSPTCSPCPSARRGHAMAYDPTPDYVLMFGGYSGGPLGDTWKYDYNSNTWTMVTLMTPDRPSNRYGAATTYHEDLDTIVLFGGHDNTGTDQGDTWLFAGSTWTLRPEGTSNPSGRQGAAMAFVPQGGRIILFGGYDGTYLDDTWSYELSTNTWEEIQTTQRPSGRSGHGMVYDPREHRIILFGGASPDYSGETWSFDPVSKEWTRLDPNFIPSRTEFAIVYASAWERMILFGGYVGTPKDETWVYDAANNTWGNLEPDQGPSARRRHAMAYDAESDFMILFGGEADSTLSAETWAYRYGPTVPFPPTNLVATPGNGRLTLTWTAPRLEGSMPITGYRVYRSGELLTEIGDDLTYVDASVTNGVPYTYRVSAVNAVGEGKPSEQITATPVDLILGTPPWIVYAGIALLILILLAAVGTRARRRRT